MLVGQSESYLRAPFAGEAEIERVVQTYAEQLFGSSIIYLPQTRISTIGGRGTVPDAIVIDVETGEWYIVEAERAVHGTWEHIAPQVSRQLAAVAAPQTAEVIVQLALDHLRTSSEAREMFREVGVSELEAHGRLQSILRRPPTIAIPIDAIPKDLSEWARTLRNNVKIWVIEKYVSASDAARVLYSLPDENLPTLSTSAASTGTLSEVRSAGSQPWQELLAAMPQLVGQPVSLEYGPRGGQRQTFEGGGARRGGGGRRNRVLAQLRCRALHPPGRQRPADRQRLGHVARPERRVPERLVSAHAFVGRGRPSA